MTARDRDDRSQRVRIPADVERPDKLLAGLTARQLAILAVTAVALWAGYAATRHLVPPVVFGVVAVPVGAVAAMLALGRFEGIAADRWVVSAWRHHRSPRRLVPAPDGITPTPAFLNQAAPGGVAPVPAPLRLPVTDVRADGIVDLGVDGLAVICRASAVTFSLRTPAEQEALVAGFARFLNSLGEPVEIVVRAEPVDLTAAIDALLDAAPGLPHPALEAAARRHARFLADLADRRDLLRREVLVVLRQALQSNGPVTIPPAACTVGPAKPPRPSPPPESPSPSQTVPPRRRAWPAPSTRPAPPVSPGWTSGPRPTSRSPSPTRRASHPGPKGHR